MIPPGADTGSLFRNSQAESLTLSCRILLQMTAVVIGVAVADPDLLACGGRSTLYVIRTCVEAFFTAMRCRLGQLVQALTCSRISQPRVCAKFSSPDVQDITTSKDPGEVTCMRNSCCRSKTTKPGQLYRMQPCCLSSSRQVLAGEARCLVPPTRWAMHCAWLF